jgi:hypothetical protein
VGGAHSIDIQTAAMADGWTCAVTVREDRSESRHRVAVRHDDLERLDPGATGPEDLVRRSFTFLLAREPKESILSSFDLAVIGRYYPEYEAEISGR